MSEIGPGRLVVTGLLGTGKTLCSEVLINLGWNFGPKLHAKSLEHPAILRIAKRICAVYEDRFNAAYAIYSPYGGRRQKALHANDLENVPPRRQAEMLDIPEAFKIPYPAAIPVMFEMYKPQVAVWCYWPDVSQWAAEVRRTDFFYQNTEDPKPDLKYVHEEAEEVREHWCARYRTPWVFFNAKEKRYHGSPEAFECNERRDALMVETGGGLGMNGRRAPDDPVNFPHLRTVKA